MPSVLGARANPDAKDLVHQNHRHVVCCGRKKLPFAGYSVVKDQMGTSSPTPSPTLRRDPDAPLRDGGARIYAPWRPLLTTRPPNLYASTPRRETFADSQTGLPPKLVATAASEGWWRIPGSNR